MELTYNNKRFLRLKNKLQLESFKQQYTLNPHTIVFLEDDGLIYTNLHYYGNGVGEDSKSKGFFISYNDLTNLCPSPEKGDWAIVSQGGVWIIYYCETDGTWNTSNQLYTFDVDLTWAVSKSDLLLDLQNVKTYIDNSISAIEIPDTSDFVTADYVIRAVIDNIPNVTDFATRDYVLLQLSGISIEGVATLAWVLQQLSGISIEGVATLAWVLQLIAGINFDKTGLATESYVQDYVTNNTQHLTASDFATINGVSVFGNTKFNAVSQSWVENYVEDHIPEALTIAIDKSLDPRSTNPVENKAVYNKFQNVDTYITALSTSLQSKANTSDLDQYAKKGEIQQEVNNYTEEKITQIIKVAEKNKGFFNSIAQLNTAVASPEDGDYAVVNVNGTWYVYTYNNGWQQGAEFTLNVDLNGYVTDLQLTDAVDGMLTEGDLKTVGGQSLVGSGNIAIEDTVARQLIQELQNSTDSLTILTLANDLDSVKAKYLKWYNENPNVTAIETEVSNTREAIEIPAPAYDYSDIITMIGTKQNALSTNNFATINNQTVYQANKNFDVVTPTNFGTQLAQVLANTYNLNLNDVLTRSNYTTTAPTILTTLNWAQVLTDVITTHNLGQYLTNVLTRDNWSTYITGFITAVELNRRMTGVLTSENWQQYISMPDNIGDEVRAQLNLKADKSQFVVLTKAAYEELVLNNQVDNNKFYFTYEVNEGDSSSWIFGGTFPITFGGSSTVSVSNKLGDPLPITLQ